jgi:hypothetical protein
MINVPAHPHLREARLPPVKPARLYCNPLTPTTSTSSIAKTKANVENGRLQGSHETTQAITSSELFKNFLDSDTTVTMARVTYFFDDGRCGGFLSIPHLGRHGSANTAGIARILERWLIEKTSNPEVPTTIIPILEEPIEQTTTSITDRLRSEGSEHLSSLAKVAINVNAGHIFTLPRCCDDEGVLWAAQQFHQEYPLFLDLTIHSIPFSSSPGSTSDSSPTSPIVSSPRVASFNSSDSYSATSFTRATFCHDSPRVTELLLHFQKINASDSSNNQC